MESAEQENKRGGYSGVASCAARVSPPAPGELVVLREAEASEAFGRWLAEPAVRGEAEFVSFRRQAFPGRAGSWLQARWHEDGGATVSRLLSYESVWEINPFEVGARRPVTRREFAEKRREVVELLDAERLLRRPAVALSNGEARRVMLARALLKKPKLLLLEDPAAGLDSSRREKLKEILRELCRRGTAVAVSCRHDDESPLFDGEAAPSAATENSHPRNAANPDRAASTKNKPVVEISNLALSLGGRKLFDGFSWTIREGERWVLRGENGSGKSTLLSLICADNPYAYACDIKVFGVERKPGRAIAPLREKIGLASVEMQEYLGVGAMEALEAALSRRPSLLLLDEPFTGLDAAERDAAKEKISAYLRRNKKTAAVFVTHRSDETPEGFDFSIRLGDVSGA